MKWLEDLFDEYPGSKNKPDHPNNRSDTAVQRLCAAFANEDMATMEAAVFKYMTDGNQWFPKISNLAPYVKDARIDRDAWGSQWGDQLATAKRTGDYTAVDTAILRWEQQRGEMRPLAEIEAEISEARQQLREMLQGVNIYAMSTEAVTE